MTLAPESAPSRRRRRARKNAAPEEQTETVPGEDTAALVAALTDDLSGEVLPYNRPGTQLRAKAGRAARKFYAPSFAGAPSSTRQAAVLNTALIGAPTGEQGITTGRDLLSHTPISHDPITGYNASPRLVTSPNVVVMGTVGGGKSSLVKTAFVIRPLLLNNRRVVVYDKKNRGGEGEYADIVRKFGSEPIRFTADGSGSTLNLLDPMIARGSGITGQSQLLQTVIRLARANKALTEHEEEAVRAGLRMTLAQYRDKRRNAVLTDILPNLDRAGDDDRYKDLKLSDRDRISQAGQTVHWALNGLLDDYAGLLDGDTSTDVDLTHKLTSFDVSQLPDEGPAGPVVMAIGNMWMLGRIRQDPSFVTNVVWEEGWWINDSPVAHLLKSSQKLSRGLGVSNIFVMHKGTDTPKDSPGYSMIQEAQSVYIYNQARNEDAQWCVDTFGFHPDTADVLQRLRPGEHIFKFGSNTESHVQHIRSDWEAELTNTDEGMAAAAALEV